MDSLSPETGVLYVFVGCLVVLPPFVGDFSLETPSDHNRDVLWFRGGGSTEGLPPLVDYPFGHLTVSDDSFVLDPNSH